MKKTTNLILVGLLAFSLLTGGASNQPDLSAKAKTNKQEYSLGARTETEYTSEWLGLKYTLNDNMIMETDEEINDMAEIGIDLLLEDDATGEQIVDYSKIATVDEMMATNITDSSNIIISAEKLLLSAMTEAQYITALRTQLVQIAIPITYNDVTTRIICGIEFSEMSHEMEVYGVTINQMMLLKKIDDRMVRITLTYYDETGLDKLLVGFSAY